MKIYTFIFLFFIIALKAQIISGRVLSKYDSTPIQYAIIGFGNGNDGTITDEKGQFTMDLSTIDKNLNIIIEIGAFEKFSEPINSFLKKSNHDILLIDKIKEISEVTIIPKNYKNKHWGVDSKSKRVVFGIAPSNKKEKEEQSRELGIKVSNNKKAKIEKVNINIASFSIDKPVKIRINIYNVKDGKPNESVLYEDIIGLFSKESVHNDIFSIDISKEGVYVDGDFFVSLQFMNYFKGHIFISAALFSKGFERKYNGTWEKVGLGSPAINIDVKVEK